MSNGPVTGDGIAITLPKGKMIFWSAVAQATYQQFVQVKDSGGTVIFEASGSSADGHSPTQYGQGMFQTNPSGDGGYTVWIGLNNGAGWQQVLWDKCGISHSGTDYYSQYTFISEDGADEDFNDTCLTLQWFEYLG
ncbi:hypothetical protein [Eilatimonas milleporae]|uniref:Uncharacterized protein n=1 Tax=Eilatimonas milleporae TaxID=911205 RepID=A0A3M0CU84_9PROT|nr:hypothetical protein [Eilatimonas milleporae]RMB12040.1 hypothetical protein BXY39_0530 [Eilatimonas milleporae]